MTHSVDRKTLRRLVLRRFGDLVVATATAAGTTTSFTDTVTFYGESSRYAGRHAYFSGGTAANLGQTRHVTGYNGTTQTLTFQGALPAAVAEGDEIELTNAYGMGVTHDAVNEALNWAVTISRPYALVPATHDAPSAFDADGANTIDLPDDWDGVASVHYQDAVSEDWHDIKRARKLNQNGWSIDHPNRQLVINGPWARAVDDLTIRLYGYTHPGTLDADDDTTALDVEWLVSTAVAHLMLDVVRPRQGAEWANQGLYYEDVAKQLKTRLTPNFGPSYTKIQG